MGCGEGRFESYLEVNLAGHVKGGVEGEARKTPQLSVFMAEMMVPSLRAGGTEAAHENEDSESGPVACPWQAAWMPQSDRPGFLSWLYTN